MPPSSSFGNWYDEQKAAENGDPSSNSSWFSIDTEQALPLFNTENLQNIQGFSFEGMKQSMEAQMPKKILGMGYQQRFKVSIFICPMVWNNGNRSITCFCFFSQNTKQTTVWALLFIFVLSNPISRVCTIFRPVRPP